MKHAMLLYGSTGKGAGLPTGSALAAPNHEGVLSTALSHGCCAMQAGPYHGSATWSAKFMTRLKRAQWLLFLIKWFL